MLMKDAEQSRDASSGRRAAGSGRGQSNERTNVCRAEPKASQRVSAVRECGTPKGPEVESQSHTQAVLGEGERVGKPNA